VRRLREKLTYSNVVASVCLFLVLGGGSALALKGRNKVDSGDIVNGTIRSRDIRDSTIDTFDVGSGQIGPADRGAAPAARVSQPHPGPGCAGGQSVSDSTDQALLFAVEEFDPDGAHVSDSACTNPQRSRLTAPLDGIYEVGAAVEWPTDGDGTRTLSLRENGVTPIATDRARAVSGSSTVQTVQTLVRLDERDYVEAVVRQSANNALVVQGAANTLALAWLSP
jgi:hypothetical protein